MAWFTFKVLTSIETKKLDKENNGDQTSILDKGLQSRQYNFDLRAIK
jgi:hypothetical protein